MIILNKSEYNFKNYHTIIVKGGNKYDKRRSMGTI